MKTDKEFLDGIYKKASVIEKESPNPKKKWRFLPLSKVMVPVVSVACIGFLILITNVDTTNKMPGDTMTTEGLIAPYQDINRGIEPAQAGFTLTGKILKLEEEDGLHLITIEVIEDMTNIYKQKEKITAQYDPVWLNMPLSVDDEMEFNIQKNLDNKLVVTGGAHGIQ